MTRETTGRDQGDYIEQSLAETRETSKDWQRPERLAETGRNQGD